MLEYYKLHTNFFKNTEDKKIVVIAGINSSCLNFILLNAGYRIIGFSQKDSAIDASLNHEDILLREVDYFNRKKSLRSCP